VAGDEVKLVSEDTWGIMNILAEARGEPHDGQVAVGNVVRERMRLRYASDGTVLGTVWRPSQFSWTLSNDKQRKRVMSADDDDPAVQNAEKAWFESGERMVVPRGTVLYHADYVSPNWAKAASVKFVLQVGRHLFYTDRGSA